MFKLDNGKQETYLLQEFNRAFGLSRMKLCPVPQMIDYLSNMNLKLHFWSLHTLWHPYWEIVNVPA